MSVSIKEERIELRVSKDVKETIINAAKINNLSLSSYIVSVMIKQAKMDIEKNETICLNNKDRDRFLANLFNPPKPNQALKDLFK